MKENEKPPQKDDTKPAIATKTNKKNQLKQWHLFLHKKILMTDLTLL
ncbi:hypothetical protein ACK350_13765 [Aeromonas veronii]